MASRKENRHHNAQTLPDDGRKRQRFKDNRQRSRNRRTPQSEHWDKDKIEPDIDRQSHRINRCADILVSRQDFIVE